MIACCDPAVIKSVQEALRTKLRWVGREEDCDLCYPAEYASDPRIRALVAAVRSASYCADLGALPGYDTAETGELQSVP